jgi:hypothetical protein
MLMNGGPMRCNFRKIDFISVPMIEEKLSKANIQVTKGKDWNQYHSFIKLTSRKSNVKRPKEKDYSPGN